MTIEEMIKEVDDFCGTQKRCDECPLRIEGVSACSDDAKLRYKMLCEYKMSEKVNHPAHYQGANECFDVMIALFGIEAVKGFCACNAFKYRFRADKKGGEEDIKKAEWYESKLIELGGL